MSGCFPTDYCHTDVNSPCYKNHELVIKKIDELEKRIESIDTRTKYNHLNLSDACKKIEELETFLFGHKLGDKNLVNQVKDLEACFICFKQDFESYLDTARKPHTCPVCDGMRKFKVFGKDEEADCPACEGKGIVWG